jgi:hypothetical protein
MNPTDKQKKRVLIVDDRPAPLAQMIDRVGALRGEFTLTITDRSGKVVEQYEDKNLIVNLAKSTLAALIGAGNGAKRISKIAFGTSSIAPDVADTVITNSISKTVDGVTYPEFNSASFAWTLDYAEANGVNIAEFGLLTVDDSLFARKTRTAIAKTADLRLTGVWKIVF